MQDGTFPYRRVKRGGEVGLGRRWYVFVACSLLVHSVALAAVSEPVTDYVTKLSRPEAPQEEMLYVDMVKAGADRRPAAAEAARAPVHAGREKAGGARVRTASQAEGPERADKTEKAVAETLSAEKPKEPLLESPDRSAAGPPAEAHEPTGEDIVLRSEAESVKPLARGSVMVVRGTRKEVLETVAPPAEANDRPAARPEADMWLAREAGIPAETDKGVKLASLSEGLAAREDVPLPPPPVTGITDRTTAAEQTRASSTARLDAGDRPPPPPVREAPEPPASETAVALDQPPESGGEEKEIVLPVIVPSATPVERPAVRMARIIEVEPDTEGPPPPPSLRISSPSGGDTDKSHVLVTGTASGGGIGSVFVASGGNMSEILLRDGGFEDDVSLHEGRNVIFASAVDPAGRIVSDRVIVNYVPGPPAAAVSITSPVGGEVVDMAGGVGMEIYGSVEGLGDVSRVGVTLNGEVYYARLTDGRFRGRLPVKPGENTVYAEAAGGDGKTLRSEAVNFRAVNVGSADLIVRADCSGEAPPPRLVFSFSPHPLSGGATGSAGPPSARIEGYERGSVALVDGPFSGIYRVFVEYDTGPDAPVVATFTAELYGGDPARKKTRTVGPITLKGRGRLPVVRLLLPEYVFWEDESYFSGMIESSSGVTKFRQPEGIVWREGY